MLLSSLLLSGLASAASVNLNPHRPTVYIIRHGEKPEDPLQDGLNAKGYERAQCLRTIFGPESHYDIGYIIAPKVMPDNTRRRSYETVAPLADDLGLVVDTTCERKETKCVARLVHEYKGPGNILISWRHGNMGKMLKKIGNSNPPEYPEDRFDIIWTEPWPYTNITDARSEECPGLDVPGGLFIQHEEM